VVPVAVKLNLPFGFVRTKSSHSRLGRVDGHKDLKRPVIIDDNIDTGATMRKTVKHLLMDERNILPVGIILYGFRNKRKAEKKSTVWSCTVEANGKKEKYHFPMTTFLPSKSR
jgi:adenine/guanine phosphoribosyltransferase-like PRPP-binding protein